MAPIASTRAGILGAATAALNPLADVIENFEAAIYEDEGDSLSDHYGGDLAQFARQQTDVLVDSYSLEGSAASGNFYGIGSTAGLPNYPGLGQTFRARVKSNVIGSDGDAGTSLHVGWMVQAETTHPNMYKATLRSSGTFGLDLRSGGSTSSLDSTSVSPSDNTEYEIQVTHEDDGNIIVKLLDDSVAERDFDGQLGDSLGAVDTTHSSGGIHWFVNPSETTADHTVVYDEYRIVESWVDYRTYNANNPLITPSDNAAATDEQYVPAIIELPGGGYAMYVKSDELDSGGESLLRLWESNDGISWTRQATTIGPSDVTPTDAVELKSPTLLYDPDSSTYYLWTRVERSSNPEQVRLFTGNSHDSLSEDATNPIVEPGDFGFASPSAVSINDVIEHDGTTYCYGGTADNIWYGTMADYGSAASPQAHLVSRAENYESGSISQVPSVFERADGDFVLTFAVGGTGTTTYNRQTYSAVGSTPTSFNPKNDIVVSAKDGSWRERWAYGGNWLKQNGQGNKKLQSVSGSYRYYFNGQPTSTSNNGSIGLAEFDGIPDFDP